MNPHCKEIASSKSDYTMTAKDKDRQASCMISGLPLPLDKLLQIYTISCIHLQTVMRDIALFLNPYALQINLSFSSSISNSSSESEPKYTFLICTSYIFVQTACNMLQHLDPHGIPQSSFSLLQNVIPIYHLVYVHTLSR